MTCLARAVVSEPGVVPDLESSPEVLTWMWMLSGSGLFEGLFSRRERPASS